MGVGHQPCQQNERQRAEITKQRCKIIFCRDCCGLVRHSGSLLLLSDNDSFNAQWYARQGDLDDSRRSFHKSKSTHLAYLKVLGTTFNTLNVETV